MGAWADIELTGQELAGISEEDFGDFTRIIKTDTQLQAAKSDVWFRLSSPLSELITGFDSPELFFDEVASSTALLPQLKHLIARAYAHNWYFSKSRQEGDQWDMRSRRMGSALNIEASAFAAIVPGSITIPEDAPAETGAFRSVSVNASPRWY